MRGFSKKQAAGFFLTGVTAGVAVALLYAPKSGMQTRKDIRKISRRAVDRLDNFQGDLRDQVNQSYVQVREVLDNVKEYVEDGKYRLQRLIQTA